MLSDAGSRSTEPQAFLEAVLCAECEQLISKLVKDGEMEPYTFRDWPTINDDPLITTHAACSMCAQLRYCLTFYLTNGGYLQSEHRNIAPGSNVSMWARFVKGPRASTRYGQAKLSFRLRLEDAPIAVLFASYEEGEHRTLGRKSQRCADVFKAESVCDPLSVALTLRARTATKLGARYQHGFAVARKVTRHARAAACQLLGHRLAFWMLPTRFRTTPIQMDEYGCGSDLSCVPAYSMPLSAIAGARTQKFSSSLRRHKVIFKLAFRLSSSPGRSETRSGQRKSWDFAISGSTVFV